METKPKFCKNCGTQLVPGSKFCEGCGSPIQPQQAPPPVPQPPAPQPQVAYQSAGAEPIVGIIPVQRSKGFLGLGVESFNMILTPNRLVFALMTQKMMNQAVKDARAEAKSEGKGFFGQWGAQLGWLSVVHRQYQSMPIDAILNQYPGSFLIANAEIKKVRFKDNTDDESGKSEYEINIDTVRGKFKFKLVYTSISEAKKLMQSTLGRL
ncbi:MAG: zinc ribbon domain-containing protein [Anaerolineales bacterium]|nr:zinc ribbon domain-containing protein [Anaerolineales bacterium]